jgi:tripartite-type tricarboxylate transporter receptor subunit TctC
MPTFPHLTACHLRTSLEHGDRLRSPKIEDADMLRIPRRGFLRLAAAAVALPAVARLATAEAFPSRPITIVVPFAAGGPTDAVGRHLAERMRATLGQTVIIENATGAGGTIGVGRVARAAPDGYTLGLGNWSTHVANGAIYTLPYDLMKDFEPVALISRELATIIAAKKTMAAKDLSELIAWLKSNPDKVSFGTAGVGSPSHVVGVLFQNLTDTRFQFVHYRGVAPAEQDLLAGQIDLLADSPTTALPQVRAGSIKAYAVTGKTRLAAAPDIPSVDEAGLPGLHLSVWFALWAPKGAPHDVIARLNSAARAALADPVMQSRLAELAQEVFPPDQQSPEALSALQKADIDKWWPIIKAAGIKAD